MGTATKSHPYVQSGGGTVSIGSPGQRVVPPGPLTNTSSLNVNALGSTSEVRVVIGSAAATFGMYCSTLVSRVAARVGALLSKEASAAAVQELNPLSPKRSSNGSGPSASAAGVLPRPI